MNKSLLDTDIYSEVLKGKNPQVTANSVTYLAEHTRYTLSVLTVYEIIWGLHRVGREERIQKVLKGLANVEVLEVDIEIAEIAGRIFGDLHRTGQLIGHPDTLIAATAIHHNLTLVTGNIAHYQRVQALGYPLQLENWKTL